MRPQVDRKNSSGLYQSGSDKRWLVLIPACESTSFRIKVSKGRPLLFAILFPFLLTGCDALKFDVMNHAGSDRCEPMAPLRHRRHRAGLRCCPVLLLTPLIAWHYRLSNKHSAFRPKRDFSWTIEGFIWSRRSASSSVSASCSGTILTRLIPIDVLRPTSRPSKFWRWGSTGNGCSSIRPAADIGAVNSTIAIDDVERVVDNIRDQL